MNKYQVLVSKKKKKMPVEQQVTSLEKKKRYSDSDFFMCEYEFHFISANETKIGMDEGRKTPKMKLFHRNLTILLCVLLDIVKEERLIIKH